MRALDELVEGVVNKLKSERALSNTYVIFTSGNGWQEGEHRIPSDKGHPYDESVHMPLLIRGPGVQAGSVVDELTVNTDFFPTLADLAGVQTRFPFSPCTCRLRNWLAFWPAVELRTISRSSRSASTP